jgi:hypothetical protein
MHSGDKSKPSPICARRWVDEGVLPNPKTQDRSFIRKIDAPGVPGKMLVRKPRKNQSFARHTLTRLLPRRSARRIGPAGRKVIAEVVRPRLTFTHMVPRSEGPTLGSARVPALRAYPRRAGRITDLTVGSISCRPSGPRTARDETLSRSTLNCQRSQSRRAGKGNQSWFHLSMYCTNVQNIKTRIRPAAVFSMHSGTGALECARRKFLPITFY